jgi:hypothetical protein
MDTSSPASFDQLGRGGLGAAYRDRVCEDLRSRGDARLGPGAILTLDLDQRQRLLAQASSPLAPCNEIIRLAARASAGLLRNRPLAASLAVSLPARIDRRRSRRPERSPEPDSGLRLPNVDSKRIETSLFLLM